MAHDPGKQKSPIVFWELPAAESTKMRSTLPPFLSRTQTLQSPSWWLVAERLSSLINHNNPCVNHTLVLLLSCAQIPAPAWATGTPLEGRHPQECSPAVPLWARPARPWHLPGPVSCAHFSPRRNLLCAPTWRKPAHNNPFEETLSCLSQDLFFIGHYKKLLLILNMDLNIRFHFPMYFFCKIDCYFSIFLSFPFSCLSQECARGFCLFVLFREHLRMVVILCSWISACLCCDLVFADSFVV